MKEAWTLKVILAINLKSGHKDTESSTIFSIIVKIVQDVPKYRTQAQNISRYFCLSFQDHV